MTHQMIQRLYHLITRLGRTMCAKIHCIRGVKHAANPRAGMGTLAAPFVALALGAMVVAIGGAAMMNLMESGRDTNKVAKTRADITQIVALAAKNTSQEDFRDASNLRIKINILTSVGEKSLTLSGSGHTIPVEAKCRKTIRGNEKDAWGNEYCLISYYPYYNNLIRTILPSTYNDSSYTSLPIDERRKGQRTIIGENTTIATIEEEIKNRIAFIVISAGPDETFNTDFAQIDPLGSTSVLQSGGTGDDIFAFVTYGELADRQTSGTKLQEITAISQCSDTEVLTYKYLGESDKFEWQCLPIDPAAFAPHYKCAGTQVLKRLDNGTFKCYANWDDARSSTGGTDPTRINPDQPGYMECNDDEVINYTGEGWRCIGNAIDANADFNSFNNEDILRYTTEDGITKWRNVPIQEYADAAGLNCFNVFLAQKESGTLNSRLFSPDLPSGLNLSDLIEIDNDQSAFGYGLKLKDDNAWFVASCAVSNTSEDDDARQTNNGCYTKLSPESSYDSYISATICKKRETASPLPPLVCESNQSLLWGASGWECGTPGSGSGGTGEETSGGGCPTAEVTHGGGLGPTCK